MRVGHWVALALLLPVFGGAGRSETKVFENFTLIDGTGKPAVSGAALVVTDGKIVYAGPKAGMNAVQKDTKVERMDLTGKYIMPGIINLHGHLGNVKGLVQDPKNFTRENVNAQLQTYASYGVTSMLSMGSDADLIFQIRSEQRAGRPSLTRVFTAGQGFTGKNGYPTTVPGMKGIPYEVENTAEIKKAVAELSQKHVDVVKIWVDDHLGREKKIPMELCEAIIENAHRSGLKVVAHIFYLDDAKKLVMGGLDGLAHSVRDKPVDDELIGLLKKRGAWQEAATLTRELSTFIYAKPKSFVDDPFFQKGISPDVLATIKSDAYRKKLMADPDLAKYEEFFETAKRNLKKLYDSGVKVGFGTDTGPPARFTGYFEQLELELMVDAGLKPAQVIKTATVDSAAFLGAKELGSLEKGKWADLVVLGKNPLDDIKNTRTIESVWIAGNRVK